MAVAHKGPDGQYTVAPWEAMHQAIDREQWRWATAMGGHPGERHSLFGLPGGIFGGVLNRMDRDATGARHREVYKAR